MPKTHHIIRRETIDCMKGRVCILVNVSRGGLIDTRAADRALKSRTPWWRGAWMFMREEGVFFSKIFPER